MGRAPPYDAHYNNYNGRQTENFHPNDGYYAQPAPPYAPPPPKYSPENRDNPVGEGSRPVRGTDVEMQPPSSSYQPGGRHNNPIQNDQNPGQDAKRGPFGFFRR
jgi:hypothetical protein